MILGLFLIILCLCIIVLCSADVITKHVNNVIGKINTSIEKRRDKKTTKKEQRQKDFERVTEEIEQRKKTLKDEVTLQQKRTEGYTEKAATKLVNPPHYTPSYDDVSGNIYLTKTPFNDIEREWYISDRDNIYNRWRSVSDIDDNDLFF
jgi:hypothetical protein